MFLDLTNIGLTNDETFSKIETQTIQQHIEDAKAELHRIDTSPDSNHHLLDRKRQITDNLGRYEAAIAPHKKLSVDIIRYIFDLISDDYGTVHLPYYRSGIPPQVLTSHVCSAWRQIALSTGSLWSNIGIRCVKESRALFGTWLSRAGTCPINIPHLALTCHPSNSLAPVVLFKELAEPFRFKEITFIIEDVQLSVLCKSPDDILETVQVQGVELRLLAKRLPQLRPLPQSLIRNLHSVDIRYIHLSPFSHDHFPLPWQQLRHLAIPGIYIFFSRVLKLLSLCPSLETCRLGVCPAPDAEEILPGTITLPHLHTLSLLGGVYPTVLFRHLSLPSLKRFSMCGRTDWDEEAYEIFRNQFNVHQLDELSIVETQCSWPVSSILRDAPLLRILCLPSAVAFDETDLGGLANGQLGQHLEYLTIYEPSCGIDAFLDTVRARRQAAKSTSSFSRISHIQVSYTTDEGVAWYESKISGNSAEVVTKRHCDLK
ncbi:hypothetical protein AX15_003487 [Amanita polypyramis BW_CC]|nr:hypothetical protein AX15_003487 [Amanita polypyramis BW_CC]